MKKNTGSCINIQDIDTHCTRDSLYTHMLAIGDSDIERVAFNIDNETYRHGS